MNRRWLMPNAVFEGRFPDDEPAGQRECGEENSGSQAEACARGDPGGKRRLRHHASRTDLPAKRHNANRPRCSLPPTRRFRCDDTSGWRLLGAFRHANPSNLLDRGLIIRSSPIPVTNFFGDVRHGVGTREATALHGQPRDVTACGRGRSGRQAITGGRRLLRLVPVGACW
jgi:hypothetical protein